MKKVQLLRDHLEHKAGDIIEVTPERADYFKNTGVAEEHKPKEKKEGSPVTAKKQISKGKEKKKK